MVRNESGVGAIVDKAIATYRMHWRPFIAVAGIWTAVWLCERAIELAGPLARAIDDPSAWLAQRPSSDAWFWVGQSVEMARFTLNDASLVAVAIAVIAGREITARAAIVHALRKTGALVANLAIVWSAVVVLALLGVPLLVVSALALGGLLPTVCLLVWWRSPRRRSRRLKRVILWTFPFGLAVYWATRWSLCTPLIMLESLGPREAMRRSAELVSGRWFRVAGVWMLVAAIVLVIAYTPSLLIWFALRELGISQDFLSRQLVSDVLVALAGVPATILTAPIGPTVFTFLVLALRNLREATDLHARLAGLDMPPSKRGFDRVEFLAER